MRDTQATPMTAFAPKDVLQTSTSPAPNGIDQPGLDVFHNEIHSFMEYFGTTPFLPQRKGVVICKRQALNS